MGISYLSFCRPVNLSTRVDRSRGKYIGVQSIIGISRFRGKYRSFSVYGYSVLFYLSTCQPVYQG